MIPVGQTDTTGELLDGRRVSGVAAARWIIDGHSYINFAGCGYLALANLPEVRNAARSAIEMGAPFSQQLSPAYGAVDPQFDAVQIEGARAFNTETSIYLPSGYLIGMAGLAIAGQPQRHIFLDEGTHYNMRDAAMLSGLPISRFGYRDANSLEVALKRNLVAGEQPLVLTDGVFATSGDLAPLDIYAQLLEPYDGRMLIDDAHGFGVVGENGRGAAEFFGVEDICLVGGTLSKALCAQGAMIGCTREEARRAQRMRPVRGATAGSPVSAAVSHASMAYMARHPDRRKRLSGLAQSLRTRLRSVGYSIINSPAPIISFGFGRRADMQALQRKLFAEGFLLPISNYIGSGPEGVFRLSVFADHEESDFDALLLALG